MFTDTASASARRVGLCLLRGRMERVTPPCLTIVGIDVNALRIFGTCTWAVDERTLEEDERNAVWTDGIDERTFCSVLLAEGTEAFSAELPIEDENQSLGRSKCNEV
ncbi:hypothetical protein JTB14_013881 [Gonioctena quinquepunctata]|nr:hypothetical protein JTB14_013881 [Gonioctena quinquepunctata]